MQTSLESRKDEIDFVKELIRKLLPPQGPLERGGASSSTGSRLKDRGSRIKDKGPGLKNKKAQG